MGAFFKALLHAAIGGAAAGVAVAGAGASLKQTGLAAAASAVTSVLSLFAKPPAQP
jgi:hypothetical protein